MENLEVTQNGIGNVNPTPGWIGLLSGERLNLLEPDPNLIHIDQIAHALSQLCRFGGKCYGFYSVAEHCVHVSHCFEDPELAMAGLLHDATEAYIGDMVRPLKVLLPAFEELENMLHEVIFNLFGLDIALMEEIKWADDEAVVVEARQITTGTWTKGIEVKIHFDVLNLTPEDGRKVFLNRYWELQVAIENKKKAFEKAVEDAESRIVIFKKKESVEVENEF